METIGSKIQQVKVEGGRGGYLAVPLGADGRGDTSFARSGAGEAQPPPAPSDLDLYADALGVYDDWSEYQRGVQLALAVPEVQLLLNGELSVLDQVDQADHADLTVIAAEIAGQQVLAGVEPQQLVLRANRAVEALNAAEPPARPSPLLRVGWRRVRALVLAVEAAALAILAVSSPAIAPLPSPSPEAPCDLPPEGRPGREAAPLMFTGVQLEQYAVIPQVSGDEFLRFEDRTPYAAHLRRTATACNCSFVGYACPIHGTKRVDYRAGRDDKATCGRTGCRRKRARCRGKRSRGVLGRLGNQHWSADVLTVPSQMQRRLAADPAYRLAVYKAAWAVLLYWLIRWAFRGRVVRLGTVVYEHPCREDESRWSWHLHFLTPLVGVDKKGKIHFGRYMLPLAALDDLRRAWKKRLAVEFGIHVPWDVDVNHRYRPAGSPDDPIEEQDAAEGKRTHAARYVARTFPTWVASVQKPHYLGLLSPAGRKLWDAANAVRVNRAGESSPIPRATAARPPAEPTVCDECDEPLVKGPTLFARGNNLYRYCHDAHGHPTGAVEFVGSARGTLAEAWTVRPMRSRPPPPS